MASEWKRLACGYMRTDGQWVLERGARMSTGGTNAWMILRRIPEHQIGRDSRTAYDARTGGLAWGLTADGQTETMGSDEERMAFVHDLDAGSLAEAKATVAIVENTEKAGA